MFTIDKEQQAAIASKLEGMVLPSGLGDKQNACSIAAINLALTGELTDKIPECMSPVIGKWIIRIQDRMPSQMRNSTEWKTALPLAAGSGRKHEEDRKLIVLDWMWEDVLPQLQDLADKCGFGDEWRRMCNDRSRESALSARAAAATYADATYAVYAAYAAYAADAAATYAADAAAAHAAAAHAAYAADAFWAKVNPVKVLRNLIQVSH